MKRREFAEAIALTALVPLLGASAGPLRWIPIAGAGLPTGGPAAPESSALARALADAIRAQYGDRLSDADFGVVIRQIEAGLERAERIRQVPLANGDEPDFVFSVVRSGTTG
jgi:hypothetical protein